jgi:hypothetical protein
VTAGAGSFYYLRPPGATTWPVLLEKRRQNVLKVPTAKPEVEHVFSASHTQQDEINM